VEKKVELDQAQKSSSQSNLSDKIDPVIDKSNSSEERKFCPNCDVEYTWSVIRRYQLGYIQLVAPVTHLWYIKGTPSYLSLLLNMKKKDLEAIIYCSESMTLEAAWNHKFLLSESPSNLFTSWQKIIKNQQEENLFSPFVKSTSPSKFKDEANLSIKFVAKNIGSSIKKNLSIDSTYLSKKFENRIVKYVLPLRLNNWRVFFFSASFCIQPISISIPLLLWGDRSGYRER
jgi:DNA-directed RNA polymerase beta' subunit